METTGQKKNKTNPCWKCGCATIDTRWVRTVYRPRQKTLRFVCLGCTFKNLVKRILIPFGNHDRIDFLSYQNPTESLVFSEVKHADKKTA